MNNNSKDKPVFGKRPTLSWREDRAVQHIDGNPHNNDISNLRTVYESDGPKAPPAVSLPAKTAQLKPLKLSACCNAPIGYDAWVDSNGELCGGPFDNYLCSACGESEPEIVMETPEPEEPAEAFIAVAPKAPGAVSSGYDNPAPTPGPWRLEFTPPTPDYKYPYMTLKSGDEGFADNGFNLTGICSEANARLLTAAPELLAACKAIDADWTREWERGPNELLSILHPDTKAIWRAIRATIARAEGRAP